MKLGRCAGSALRAEAENTTIVMQATTDRARAATVSCGRWQQLMNRSVLRKDMTDSLDSNSMHWSCCSFERRCQQLRLRVHNDFTSRTAKQRIESVEHIATQNPFTTGEIRLKLATVFGSIQ